MNDFVAVNGVYGSVSVKKRSFHGTIHLTRFYCNSSSPLISLLAALFKSLVFQRMSLLRSNALLFASKHYLTFTIKSSSQFVWRIHLVLPDFCRNHCTESHQLYICFALLYIIHLIKDCTVILVLILQSGWYKWIAELWDQLRVMHTTVRFMRIWDTWSYLEMIIGHAMSWFHIPSFVDRWNQGEK